MTFPSNAVNLIPDDTELEKNAELYAYMDYNKASNEMKQVILHARNIIIFNSTWIADGYEGGILNPDGSFETLPFFSELFPDWEIPEVPNNNSSLLLRNDENHDFLNYIESTIMSYGGNPEYFNRSTFLPKAPATLFGSPFTTFTSRHFHIFAGALNLPGRNYNIGIAIENRAVLSFQNFTAGRYVQVNAAPGLTVRVFASTHCLPGTAVMRVYGV